jgi:ATP-binding cassette, subfamily B, bacterial
VNASASVWFYLGRLIGFSKGWYALNIVFWVSFYILPLVPGYVSKLFFDALEQKNPVWNGIPYTVQMLVALVLVYGVLQTMVIFTAIAVNIPWRFRSSGLLRLNIMRRILAMPGAKAYNNTVGETLNTLRDDAEEIENAGDWTLDMIGQIAYMAIAIAVLLSIDAELTLYVFLPLVVVTYISYLARNRLEELQKSSRETSSHYTSLLGEVYQSVQAIQVAGAERSVLHQLEQRSQARQYAMLRNVALNQALGVFSSNIVALGTGLILLLAGAKMRSGEFTVGEFSLFVLYLWEVGAHTEFFGNFMATVQRAGVAFGRMMGLMQGSPVTGLVTHQTIEIRRDPPPLEPIKRQSSDELQQLEVKGLTYLHPDSGRGIENASFTLERGEFVVITGRIGSGKTTLLRALLGLLPAQSGQIYWNNQTILEPAEFMTPPRSAYTPQVPALISGTVRENIALGTNHDLTSAIKNAVLETDLEQLPHALETLVGVRGLKLSGGQLQRTAAARMFAQNSSLLVFDDISSALDVRTEQTLWERVSSLGKTCLVVSHRRPALHRATRIILLEHGQVSDTGSLEELLARSSEMRRLWADETA